jgi:hypothetical protein
MNIVKLESRKETDRLEDNIVKLKIWEILDDLSKI